MTLTTDDRLRECRAAYRESQARVAALEEELSRQRRYDRCHRIWDDKARWWVHIPMCSMAAHNGPDQCTCDYPRSRRERELEDEVWALSEELRYSRSARKMLWEQLQVARNRIRAMSATPRREEGA